MEALKSSYKTFSDCSIKSNLNSIKIENARRRAAYLENQNEESRRLVSESEATMNRSKAVYSDMTIKAKATLQKAKNLSKNFTPEDDGFDEFRDSYDALSTSFSVLNDEKMTWNAKIGCLNTVDDQEFEEFEARLQLIENLEQELKKAETEVPKITKTMDELREEWLSPLRQLIADMNVNFGTAFEQMGCAGEISLNCGDDEMDFAKYGLRIKV